MAIKNLVNKTKLSGRLATWILLLEEFNYTVEYKLGSMHLQTDHLSRLSEEIKESPVDDRLVDENLFVVTAESDWYADIVEFLTTQKLPENYTNVERRNVRVHSRHFAVIVYRLFKRGADGLLRRCVSKVEVSSILEACHESACGGHFLANLAAKRFLEHDIFAYLVQIFT